MRLFRKRKKIKRKKEKKNIFKNQEFKKVTSPWNKTRPYVPNRLKLKKMQN